MIYIPRMGEWIGYAGGPQGRLVDGWCGLMLGEAGIVWLLYHSMNMLNFFHFI